MKTTGKAAAIQELIAEIQSATRRANSLDKKTAIYVAQIIHPTK